MVKERRGVNGAWWANLWVKYSNDLDSAHLDCALWPALADVVAGPGRTVVLTDPTPSGQRYYRLVTPRQP